MFEKNFFFEVFGWKFLLNKKNFFFLVCRFIYQNVQNQIFRNFCGIYFFNKLLNVGVFDLSEKSYLRKTVLFKKFKSLRS